MAIGIWPSTAAYFDMLHLNRRDPLPKSCKSCNYAFLNKKKTVTEALIQDDQSRDSEYNCRDIGQWMHFLKASEPARKY